MLLCAIEHNCIVLSVASCGHLAFSACGTGAVKVWDISELILELLAVKTGGDSTTPDRRRRLDSDATAVGSLAALQAAVGAPVHAAQALEPKPVRSVAINAIVSKGALLSMLRQFVAYKSVSSKVRLGARVLL